MVYSQLLEVVYRDHLMGDHKDDADLVTVQDGRPKAVNVAPPPG